MIVASDPSDLYVLQEENISLYGNVSYQLSASNWTSGQENWPPLLIDIGEGAFSSFEQAHGGPAQLLVEGGTLVMVTLGTWVLVSEELFEPSLPVGSRAIWVLEWNATTGTFLRAQQANGAVAPLFPGICVAADDGWVAVGVYASTNFTASTVPIEENPSTYGEWNTTVSTASNTSELFESPTLSMGDGLISLALMGNANLVAVLNGTSGSVVWQGVLPNSYRVPGGTDWSYLPSVVGEFTNVVRSGASFYYIANQTGNPFLDSFDFSTNATASLANLSLGGDPLNSQLSLLDTHTLVVTGATAEHYWAFSMTGTPLWNLTLALSQVSSTGVSSVGGIDFAPLPLGGTDALVGSMWSWDTSSYVGDNYPVSTFSDPLAIVNGETGQLTWKSSYTQSQTLGPVSPHPVTYWPFVTEGSFAAFGYYPGNGLGWILSVAEFPGVPS